MTTWGAWAGMALVLGTGSAALAQPSDAEITAMIDDTVAVCRPQYDAVMRLARAEGASDRDMRFRIAQFQYEINNAPPIQLQPRNEQTRQMFGNEVTDLLDCMIARQVALRGGAPRQTTEGPLGLRGMPVPQSAPVKAAQSSQPAKPKPEEPDHGLYWLRGTVEIPEELARKCEHRRICLDGMAGFRVELDEPPVNWTGGIGINGVRTQLFGQTPLRPGTSFTVVNTSQGRFWNCQLISTPQGRTPSGPNEPNASREIDAIKFSCSLTPEGQEELQRLEAQLTE